MRWNIATCALLLALPFGSGAQSGITETREENPHLYRPGVIGLLSNETVETTQTRAQSGDAGAQARLGYLYSLGLDIPRDDAEAVDWYRKAAEQGDADAQVSLGFSLMLGRGIGKDALEGAKWFQKAAGQSNVMGEYDLARCYSVGEGVPQDVSASAQWFQKAAQQGDAESEFALGFDYSAGDGVVRDEMEALKWYRKAAEQGNQFAQANLGEACQLGQGMPPDINEAVKWFRRAARQGNVLGEASLGMCCESGNGVPRDYVEAYAWLNLAAAQGLPPARDELPKLEAHMIPEQIAEAQRMSTLFVPQPETARDSAIATQGQAPDQGGLKGEATGFFITEDGYLITSEHVVRGANRVELLTSEGKTAASIVKVDPVDDLALLKAAGRFEALPLAPSSTARMGNAVATVGFPNVAMQGFAPKLAQGEIAALSGFQDDPHYFQISVPVQPGNSGGALVDGHGNVVGVVSAKLNAAAAIFTTGAVPENVNYAVKSTFLLGFLESVPDVSERLKKENLKSRTFNQVIKSAEKAAVLITVY